QVSSPDTFTFSSPVLYGLGFRHVVLRNVVVRWWLSVGLPRLSVAWTMLQPSLCLRVEVLEPVELHAAPFLRDPDEDYLKDVALAQRLLGEDLGKLRSGYRERIRTRLNRLERLGAVVVNLALQHDHVDAVAVLSGSLAEILADRSIIDMI